MGNLGNRLAQLEGRSRERAVEELRRAWRGLTDEEVALLLAPYVDGIREPMPEERQIDERLRALVPEELITMAIGLEGGMEQGEVERRRAEDRAYMASLEGLSLDEAIAVLEAEIAAEEAT